MLRSTFCTWSLLSKTQEFSFIGREIPYDPVCPSIGRSVRWLFDPSVGLLVGLVVCHTVEFHFPCFYRSTFSQMVAVVMTVLWFFSLCWPVPEDFETMGVCTKNYYITTLLHVWIIAILCLREGQNDWNVSTELVCFNINYRIHLNQSKLFVDQCHY